LVARVVLRVAKYGGRVWILGEYRKQASELVVVLNESASEQKVSGGVLKTSMSV